MSLDPLHYDTFQALESDCSLPLASSLQCLIRTISCTLITMRTVINPQQYSSTPGTPELCDQDVDRLQISPGDAISETIRRFTGILGQIDEAILNRMLLLEANVKHTDLISIPSSSANVEFKSAMRETSQARKLTLQILRNLRRVGSELESFVYWTDNFLLASMADSTRDDVSNDASSKSNHDKHEETFNALIDGCVDVAQAAWSIRAQLSQAHAMLSRPSSLTHNVSRGRSSPPCRPRKPTTTLRTKPRLQYEVGDSLGRPLRHRSVRKFLPRKATGVNHCLARLTALLEPGSCLKVIQVSRYFLQNGH